MKISNAVLDTTKDRCRDTSTSWVDDETGSQRKTFLENVYLYLKEAEEKKLKEIEGIRQNIYKLQNRLSVLKGEANGVREGQTR